MNRLEARLATAADARLVWEWRNDPATRANSLTSESISWLEHCRWFDARLRDPNTALFIIEESGEPVADVRYDRRDDQSATAHIAVAPLRRGLGIGTAALRMTAPLALNVLRVAEIEAAVKPDNVASLHAFLRSGFATKADVPLEPDIVLLRYPGK